MKVKCINDYQDCKKGEIYELHTAPIAYMPATHYLECDNRKCGFITLKDGILTRNFEIIEDDDKHDEHYKTCAIEPWVIMENNFTKEEFVGFLKGNIVKYVNRIGRKGQDLDDCDKIANYAQKLKEVLQKDIVQE